MKLSLPTTTGWQLTNIEYIRGSGCFRLEAKELQVAVSDSNTKKIMLARTPGQTSLLFPVGVPGNAADWPDVTLQGVRVSVQVYGLRYTY